MKSYWNHDGLQERRVEVLHRIIDEVFDFDNRVMPKSRTKHLKLESFRKGKYAYYRFYNDGDYPRTFARDLPPWHSIKSCSSLIPIIGIEEKLEVLINQRINAAWDESIANGYIKDSEQWIG